LLLPAGVDADAVVKTLKQGAPVAQVIAKFSLKELGDGAQSSLPDVALSNSLGYKLFSELRKLKTGDISPPVAAADGVHLLVVAQRDAPTAQTFEAARQTVSSDFQRDALQAAQNEYVRFLRSKADVEVRKATVKLADAGKAVQP
jgi:parvulin-like peptidyl-prolyl isomerase